MLLQMLFSERSERQLMEQVHYNLLLRRFMGLAMDDAVWVPTVFTKNRERLIEHDAVIKFFNEVVAIAQQRDLLSGEHFSVDDTLIQAWCPGMTTRAAVTPAAAAISKVSGVATTRMNRRRMATPGRR